MTRPLLELFVGLRRAGLPLGLEEYRAVRRALVGGFGTGSEEELLELCQLIWARDAHERTLIAHHFERLFSGLADGSTPAVERPPHQPPPPSEPTNPTSSQA